MSFEDAFTPVELGPLRLRNRFVKTATYEGLCPDAAPSPALVEHHRLVAAGGVGMSTVAYASVSADGRTFPEQLYMRPSIVPGLARVAGAVHEEGAAASLQLGHCGYFSKNTKVRGRRSLGPSRLFNAYGVFKGMLFSRAMTPADLDAVVDDFGEASRLAIEAGFDAVELHLGHGYLLSQFLSPWSNRRQDEYGGPIHNRLRLPLRVVRRVREVVGSAPILCKINLDDGFAGGLGLDDALAVAAELDRAGVDALVTSGGFTSRTPLYLLRGDRPLRDMIAVEGSRAQRAALHVFGPAVVKAWPFEENFFQPAAERVLARVGCRVCLLGGICSREGVERAMDAGFPLLAVGRALIHDPDFLHKLRDGTLERSGCTHCNRCIAEMDRDGVRCALPEAPGHTAWPRATGA
ncbi:MAG: NADH:flavin oxidoreductase [Myxococcota bacterium]